MAALMPRPSGKECTEMELKHLLYNAMQKRCIRMNIYDAMHGWIKISDAAKCRIGLKKIALQSFVYCRWTAERVTGWFPGHSTLQI